MDRVAYDADVMQQFFAEQQRAFVIANISGEENFDPLDKTDREDIVPGTYLKLWDDVQVYGTTGPKVRIICAAGGRDNFFSYRFDSSNGGHVLENWPKDSVTDRAPADPEEEPMPNGSIFIPEDPPPGP
jgi:hypothetical protein